MKCPRTIQHLLLAVLLLTTGCAGITVSKATYAWTPNVTPAKGTIDATVLVEANHEMAPEIVNMWKKWLNTDQNILNWKSAVEDAVMEDVSRSNIFGHMTNSVTDDIDFMVRIDSRESRPGTYRLDLTLKVIDPSSKKTVLSYQEQADLGKSSFSYAPHMKEQLSTMLADIRTRILVDFSGKESKGYIAFLSPEKKRKEQAAARMSVAEKEDIYASSMEKEDRPPEITILSPKISRGIAVVPQKEMSVIGLARDESKIVMVLVNEVDAKLTPLTDGVNFRARVPLLSTERELVIRAIDQHGNIATKTLPFSREPSALTQAVQSPGAKPNLWVLAVGISAYKDKNLHLQYADDDARAIAQMLKSQEGKLFTEVNYKLLLNENGTRENILDGMSRFLGMAAYNDLIVIFVAGHGVKDKQTGSYYFLTYDSNPDTLMTRGLLWSTFDEAQKRLSVNVSKVMLLIDTCHAGAMQVAMRGAEGGEELSQALRQAEGTFVLAASKPGEDSAESDQFKFEDGVPGHGAFTFAILEGLQGHADMDNDKSISVAEISSYVAKKVPRITKGKQHPYFRLSGTDMPIFLQ